MLRNQADKSPIDRRFELPGAEAGGAHGALDAGALLALQQADIGVDRHRYFRVGAERRHLLDNGEQARDRAGVVAGHLRYRNLEAVDFAAHTGQLSQARIGRRKQLGEFAAKCRRIETLQRRLVDLSLAVGCLPLAADAIGEFLTLARQEAGRHAAFFLQLMHDSADFGAEMRQRADARGLSRSDPVLEDGLSNKEHHHDDRQNRHQGQSCGDLHIAY